MSITALVTGKLTADPDSRIGSNGKRFIVARVSAHNGDERVTVSVIAFGSVADQLAELGKGDAVAITGRAKVTTWANADGATSSGLSVAADAVLTSYHVRRRREAFANSGAGPAPAPNAPDFDRPAGEQAGS